MRRSFSVLLVCAIACSDDAATSPDAATVAFDPEARFDAEGAFFDFPYPSDARRTKDGAPDVAAFPDLGIGLVTSLKRAVAQRTGFPMVPVAYFKLTKAPRTRDASVVAEDGALLLDVDPASPQRGRRIPIVIETLRADPYVPENLVAIAARPGIVLGPRRKYAFVLLSQLGLEDGGDLAQAAGFAALARGEGSETLRALYAPLFETLDTIGVARDGVAAATVFTTGDVVADNADLARRVEAAYAPELTDIVLDGATFPDVCHLRAKIVLPQFQRGTPPFATEGLFEIGPDGTPVKQRDEAVPVSITLPKSEMPQGGYPLVFYFHGSGGVARELVDGGEPVPDPLSTWPAVVVARRGFATAGSSLPISPERVPGAGDFDYVNVNNLVAVRDTFRQGIVESRLVLSALLRARIAPSALGACTGPTLPAGEVAFRFAERVHAQGQSMGGMYTNLVSATEPRIHVAVPTGAGGYWTYFLLTTTIRMGIGPLLSVILKTPQKVSFLHPAMSLGETAVEAVDPIVSASRLAQRPLPSHPVRPVYEPVGKDDNYFPTEIFDAMVLAYGHPRAGDEVWPQMRDAQRHVGLDSPASYPVSANAIAENGTRYTGVAVQYAGDGLLNSHQVYRRLEAVQHQFGCFHDTFRRTGSAIVPAPAPRDAPCP